MKCHFCGHKNTNVVDTRAADGNTSIRRRRVCESCGQRFTTYERIDIIPITVIKRDGTREIFERNKVLNGIIKSCNKRPISVEQIENLVSEIEYIISNTMNKEIESKEIGELVMDKLKDIDEVAYVRFASVYRQFKDINTFMKELANLLEEKK